MTCRNDALRPRGAWLLTLLLVAAFAFTAGTLVRGPRDAAAEVRETPAPKAFESGGERSVAVLKEIQATLKTMDTRLEKIESFVVEVKAAMRR